MNKIFDILKLQKKYRLGNSSFRGNWCITKEMLNNSYLPKEELKQIAIREMITQLSKKILTNHSNIVNEQDMGEHIQIGIELLVLDKKQFKDIVEAAIVLLTDEQIINIRNS